MDSAHEFLFLNWLSKSGGTTSAGTTSEFNIRHAVIEVSQIQTGWWVAEFAYYLKDNLQPVTLKFVWCQADTIQILGTVSTLGYVACPTFSNDAQSH